MKGKRVSLLGRAPLSRLIYLNMPVEQPTANRTSNMILYCGAPGIFHKRYSRSANVFDHGV